MDKFNIDIINQLIKDNKIIWTNHVIIRLLQRNMTQENVKHALMHGEIIESYEEDYPYPSCLVYGLSEDNKVIHIVCGYNGENLWIIIAYYPNDKEWENDMKTRKGIE